MNRFCAVVAITLGMFAASGLAAENGQDTRAEVMTQHMTYDAFDRLPHESMKVLNAELTIGFAPGQIEIGHARVLKWIEHSARVVGAYYGEFPVSSARILVVPFSGSGVRTGQSFGYRGAATRVIVGSSVTDAQLN